MVEGPGPCKGIIRPSRDLGTFNRPDQDHRVWTFFGGGPARGFKSPGPEAMKAQKGQIVVQINRRPFESIRKTFKNALLKAFHRPLQGPFKGL